MLDACVVVHGDATTSTQVTNEQHWVAATRVMLGITGLVTAVLVTTGVMLLVGYRPSMTPAFARVQDIAPNTGIRTVRRVASRLLYPAFGAAAIAAAGLALVRHRAARLVAPIVAGLAVLAATFTGYLLPWDQLAFSRVTVGTSIRGYGAILFDGNVKYVLVGDREIGPSTLARWVWIHSVGVTLVLVVALVLIAVQTRGTARFDRRARSVK